jgi:uncharacterized protein YjbI with pentapeptide repeats
VAVVIGLATLSWLALALLHHPKLPRSSPISLHDLIGVLQLVFASVAGAGALVALVMAYRRQRVAETVTAHDRTRVLNERFTAIAAQIGDQNPAVRLAGVHALAGLADDWPENRQTCVDVLCAYLRMPTEPEPGDDAPAGNRLAFQSNREVRHTVIRVIAKHLRETAPVSWQGLDFDFTGVVFDAAEFVGAVFAGSEVSFADAVFSGRVSFDGAKFVGGQVSFGGAKFVGGQVSFGGAKFAASQVSFYRTAFASGLVSFAGAVFAGGAVSFRGAEFSGADVKFLRAAFSGSTVDFHSAMFSGGQVSFRDARFSGGNIWFGRSVFSGGKVYFVGAVFSGSEVHFSSVFKGSEVYFSNAKISAGRIDLLTSEFYGGRISFSDATFSGGEVRFGEANRINFNGARVVSGGHVYAFEDEGIYAVEHELPVGRLSS